MSVCLILGPMFSGKSTELHRQIDRYVRAKKKCICITHGNDLRYSTDDVLMTHSGLTYPAIRASNLADIPLETFDDVEMICIDEGQWFDDIAAFAHTWAYCGKHVVIAALQSTYEKKEWKNVVPLFVEVNQLILLTAVCVTCGADASFTRRLSDETALDVVGGEDKYIAQCRKCFIDFPSR